MRNSNSRDKPTASTYSQNKLTKTQIPPKDNGKQSLNSTQYKLPPSNKRIQPAKNITASTSSKQIPRQDLNFDIQKNMTQSKLYVAKQSLQLLKKKMNRTGMSRQKISPSTQNIQTSNYPVQSMKKIKSQTTKNSQQSKNIQNYQPEYQQNNYKQQSKYSKTKYQQQNSKLPPKKVLQQKLPAKRQSPPIQQQYYNQREEIPISKNHDFNALLEKELKKEENLKNVVLNNSNKLNGAKNNNQYEEPEEYGDAGQLFQCSKGCGRQFNERVLSKHQKICEKVFLTKRKVFNTAAQRKLEGQQGTIKYTTSAPNKKLNQTKKPEAPKSKIPKWKIQSAQLRAGLMTKDSKPLTKEQQMINNMQKQSLISCNFCGRKFNQKAAERHIPLCQQKAKNMSRPSNGKKK